MNVIAIPAKLTAPPAAPMTPSDPLVAYYRNVRQTSIQLAKDRYKQGFKVRTQEFIRGRGTLAIVDEEICMGCTHCFDNCAFESIGMVDRKFALPEYSYTSRKAVIIEENCVGCEKCALVCPVDAITMVTKYGFEVKEGRVISTTAPPVPAARPTPAVAAGPKPVAAPVAPPPEPEEM
jgi:ferredoxin